MLKILIVDDEPLVRMGIKSTLVKCGTEVEVVSDVSNGQKAIEVLTEQPVDIVFTDIKMPEMNGLELIKWIREHRRGVKSVVLSCYNDFEYVREAFTYGTFDYILKYDIDAESIGRIIAKIDAELKETGAENAGLSEKNIKNIHILKKSLLKDICAGECYLDAAELNRQFQKLNIRLDAGGSFMTACLEIDYPADFYTKHSAGASLENEIKNILDEYFKNYVFEIYAESVLRYMVLMNVPATEHADETAKFAQVQGVIQKYLQCMVSIGLSGTGNYSALKDLFSQAVKTCEERFYEGPGYVAKYTGKTTAAAGFDEKLMGRKARIIREIGTENFGEIILQLEFLRSDFLRNHIPVPEVKRTYLSLLEVIKIHYHQELSELGPDIAEMMNGDIMAYGFLDELHKYITAVITGLSGAKIGPVAREDYSLGVQKCIDTIRARYYEEMMNLALLSDMVGYSPAYLSRIFKKETGRYIVDYINEVRIGHAKKMLENPKNKVYQVAEKVGYANYSYFSKIFKKITGISPSEYTKQ